MGLILRVISTVMFWRSVFGAARYLVRMVTRRRALR
jgi:hypothetical protein